MALRSFEFSLDMNSDQVKNIMYGSSIKRVSVLSREGLRLELPLSHFQKFVSYDGIHGSFKLVLNGSSFVSLERISG